MKIAIFGVGNYTEVIVELCNECGYDNIDLYHFNEQRVNEILNNYKVVGTYEDFIKNKDYKIPVFVAIGDNKVRGKWLDKLRDLGFKTPKLIHPKAYVSPSAVILDGCYIHANAFVWTKSKLGNNSIVSPNAMVAHHVTIGKNSLISANSMVGSYNILGDNVLFGINACSISSSKIKIGKNTIIGANSLITKSVSDNSVMVGSPAEQIKNNE